MRAENFGKNLKEVIIFLDLTQAEFAEKVGMTQAGVSQLVNGEREPSLASILKILEVVPVKFERLFK
jgi:transcriptional regulator with XRE-family HTH domain